MYFADCPRCGKPDSSHNGFDLCQECQEKERQEEEPRPLPQPELMLVEVEDDDHC